MYAIAWASQDWNDIGMDSVTSDWHAAEGNNKNALIDMASFGVIGTAAKVVSVAARRTLIGFTPGLGETALNGMRSGGGHAIRHLQAAGLISSTGSLANRVSEARALLTPLLESPITTFSWKVGATPTRGYYGIARGEKLVAFIATEGPYQGKLISAIVSDAAQIAK